MGLIFSLGGQGNFKPIYTGPSHQQPTTPTGLGRSLDRNLRRYGKNLIVVDTYNLEVFGSYANYLWRYEPAKVFFVIGHQFIFGNMGAAITGLIYAHVM